MADKQPRHGGSYSKDPKTGKTTLVSRTTWTAEPKPAASAPAATAPKPQPQEVSDGTL